MVDEDDLDAVVRAPFEQRFAHLRAHLSGQSMDRLGPIEAQPPDAPLDADQNVVSHWRSMSLLTITRMI
jgi:hypothetical protein